MRGETLKLPGGSDLVAGLAIYRRVRADERKTILMVANRGHGDLPAFDGVTRFAIRAKLATVNVRMAVRALLSNIRKDEFHVALSALYFFVHPAQPVARLVVVKLRDTADRLPAKRRVAVLARNTQGAVRIAYAWFLCRALLPLGASLKRKETHTELKESSTAHDTTSVDTPIPSIG